MTTLNRAIKWYINGDLPGGRNALLEGITPNPPNIKPALMQGDQTAIQLYFRKMGAVGVDTTAYTLDAGYTLYLVGKLASALDDGAVLFSVSSWTSPGEGEEHYSGTLNLNTAEIDAAFAATTESDTIDVSVDIEYRDAGNTERVTYRADIQICRQVYQGSEAVPTPNLLNTFESPGGYIFQLSITDDGQIQIVRAQ
jgi:hypothetical protein